MAVDAIDQRQKAPTRLFEQRWILAAENVAVIPDRSNTSVPGRRVAGEVGFALS